MTQPKVIAYSNELPHCNRFKEIFADFEILSSDSEKDFLEKIRSLPVGAAVICFCSSKDKEAEKLARLNALTGPIPLFACLISSDNDFIFHAGQAGIENFLVCTGNVEKIQARVHQAILKGGLKRFLEHKHHGCLASSFYIRKMIDIIVENFPKRVKEEDMAKCLHLSRQWLESLIIKAFGINYSRLIRSIWINQALIMMKNTSYNNSDIAMQLNYSEEWHMARDFKKELGYSPNKIRRLLVSGKEPEDLLN